MTEKIIAMICIVALLNSSFLQAQHRRLRRKTKKPQTNITQTANKDCILDAEIEGCTIDPIVPELTLDIPFDYIRCSDCIVFGKPLKTPAPCYPHVAKVAHVSGEVQVKLVIDEQGKVIWADAVSGHTLLRRAAVKAACHAKFTPSFVIGRKIKVKASGVLTYNFKLD